jgi:hypothetical protein
MAIKNIVKSPIFTYSKANFGCFTTSLYRLIVAAEQHSSFYSEMGITLQRIDSYGNKKILEIFLSAYCFAKSFACFLDGFHVDLFKFTYFCTPCPHMVPGALAWRSFQWILFYLPRF